MDKNRNCLGKHKILNSKIRYTFIFIFIFSVFSLTLQASITQICKESKAFKSQSQQSPITEEEEERSHDSDESADEEIVYLKANDSLQYDFICNPHFFKSFELDCCSSSIEIQIPPPKI